MAIDNRTAVSDSGFFVRQDTAVDPAATRTGRPIRVLAADDHPLFLRALGLTIQASPALKLVAVAEDGVQALAKAQEYRPDVTVLDMRMPELDGREVLTQLRRSGLPTRTLFLSEYVADEVVQRALRGGDCGFMPKSATGAEICAAIIMLARGEPVDPGSIASQFSARRGERGRRYLHLTPREMGIVELMADGGTAQVIADRLNLALPTVKTHIQHVYLKLGVNGRGAAIAEAMRRGLLT